MALLGYVNLAVELSAVDSRRYGAMILSLFVTITLAGFMLLPSAPRGGSRHDDESWPESAAASDRGTTA
jgi:hypothetical protein